MTVVVLVAPVGVPDMRAVPLWLSVNVRPAGKAPDSVTSGVGEPVVVMDNAPPLWLRVKSAVDALVMAGASEAADLQREALGGVAGQPLAAVKVRR